MFLARYVGISILCQEKEPEYGWVFRLITFEPLAITWTGRVQQMVNHFFAHSIPLFNRWAFRNCNLLTGKLFGWDITRVLNQIVCGFGMWDRILHQTLSLSPLATNRSLTYLDYECILIAYVHQTINPQPPWQTAHAMLQRPLFWSQVLYITPRWWPSQLAFQQLRVAPLPVSWWQARTFFRHFLSGLIKWHQWECLQLAAT